MWGAEKDFWEFHTTYSYTTQVNFIASFTHVYAYTNARDELYVVLLHFRQWCGDKVSLGLCIYTSL